MDKEIPIIDTVRDAEKNEYQPYADKDYIYIPIIVHNMVTYRSKIVYYKIPKKLFQRLNN